MANMIDLAGYIARIELDQSDFNSGLDGIDREAQGRIGGLSNWMKVTVGAGIVALGASVGIAMKKSIDEFSNFEGKMNEVFTLLPDATEKSMNEMSQQVKDLAKDMGVIPNEIAPALYQALSASVPKDNVFEFLEVANKAAIAGITDTETVVDGLTSVINAYQMDATKAMNVSDIMFQTVKLGKTSFEELSGSLYNVIPTASALGVSFEDVGAGLAAITAQGTPTSVATTQMRQMFVELSKEGSKTSTLFKELAGQSFKEFIAGGGDVQQALQMLEKHSKDSNLGINDLFSSVEAGNAALALTGAGTQLFSNALEGMANSANSTDMAFETMDQGIGRSIDRIKANMNVMLIELGENLAPAVATVTDYILDAMPTIQSVIQTTFNVVGTVIGVFVDTLHWLVGTIKEFLRNNEESFNSVREVIMSVVSSIQNFIVEFIEFVKRLWELWGEDILSYTSKYFDAIKVFIESTLNIVKGIFDFFIALLKGDWEGMGQSLLSITENFFTLIQNAWNMALEAIKLLFTLAIDSLKIIATNIMQGIWDAFKSVWNSIITWFSDVFNSLFSWFDGLYDRFFDIGELLLDSVWDGLKSIWSDIADWVSDKVSWLSDKLAFWKSSQSKMNSGGSSTVYTISTPSSIPSYDVGTPFVPNDQLAFIHKGEAIIPAKYNPFNAEKSSKSNSLDTTSKMENHYHISKLEFPNVRDSREIESAINNLSTYALQWAGRR